MSAAGARQCCFGWAALGVQTDDEPLTCSLSMVPLTKPIKNHCGHKFNEPQLTEWMRAERKKHPGRGIACPKPGCGKLLQPETFETDESMEYEIQEQQKKKSRRTQRADSLG